jgi:hypothetical protein
MTDSDYATIQQLVLSERQARDRGWWGQMASAYHPSSRVKVSWFSGTGPEFVARSRDQYARIPPTTHRMSPPVMRLSDTRAVAEAPAVIEQRVILHDREADLASRVRLLYRLELVDGSWLINALDCIYEHDTLTPTEPGATIDVDESVLGSFRAPYRHIAYYMTTLGLHVAGDLYGDDRPDALSALYVNTFGWLGVRSPAS